MRSLFRPLQPLADSFLSIFTVISSIASLSSPRPPQLDWVALFEPLTLILSPAIHPFFISVFLFLSAQGQPFYSLIFRQLLYFKRSAPPPLASGARVFSTPPFRASSAVCRKNPPFSQRPPHSTNVFPLSKLSAVGRVFSFLPHVLHLEQCFESFFPPFIKAIPSILDIVSFAQEISLCHSHLPPLGLYS